MGLPNGVAEEKKGNKRTHAEESFFSWFNDTDHNGLNEIQDEQVAEIIKDDLWPNPLTYFNNEADEEDFEVEDDDDDDEFIFIVNLAQVQREMYEEGTFVVDYITKFHNSLKVGNFYY
ncbi:hypothetical protein ACS0TY_025644 [Phlomoides rotata]